MPNPTIAVVGASNDRRKFGNRAVRAYACQGWNVYPVNPHETLIEGRRATGVALRRSTSTVAAVTKPGVQ